MQSDASHLRPLALIPLPLGSIQPQGWLLDQLRIQADGLSGHLDEFWPDIRDSGWIGGQAEGWERGPYWLDGVVPLAFLLDDEGLKGKVRHWMDYILTHQQEDGWLGPVQDESGRYRAHDPWPVTVFLKAALQYEAASGDERVLPTAIRFLSGLDALLDRQMLFDWSKMRWADLVWCIHSIHDRTGERWLLDLAGRIKRQGYDWLNWTRHFPYRERVPTGRWAFESHVVNIAMALKQPAVWYRQSGEAADAEASLLMIRRLDRYHGQATGLFTGDENLAGLNPSQGTELCAVMEYLFSLEVLLSILGDPALADRLERIAYNALPATFSPDMWSHQYDQQANQVVCQVSEERVYTTNGPDANLFGLEPNFGCCTANLSQGWPKFAAHLWMRTPEPGLAALAYAPCRLQTTLKGTKVTAEVETDYPFEENIRVTVRVDEPVDFPLLLRIPAWASLARVTVDSQASVTAQAGDLYRIDRRWSDLTRIALRLPMQPVIRTRSHGGVAIERGPLVYALKISEDWQHLRGELPHADWEVHPKSAWNYALALDPSDPAGSIEFEEKLVGTYPFCVEGAPVKAVVRGRRLPDWGLENNAAAPPPASPVTSAEPLEDLTLIPYGCTNLRVTEFPVLEEETEEAE